jgi:ribosome-interacting GTPase 1
MKSLSLGFSMFSNLSYIGKIKGVVFFRSGFMTLFPDPLLERCLMVTNLPQEAKAKWNEVTLTRNPEERLRLLGEFLSLVPKHKGTEKLCRQVKRQMAQLREEIERRKKAAKRVSRSSYFVEKAGAAQVAVVGPTNAGRSSLLRAVTNSTVEVASWPFSTRVPTPGMLPFEDIQFQLVEVPPIVDGSSEGKADGFQVLSTARNSDGIMILVDLTDDPSGNFLMVKQELENARILTKEPHGEVEIIRRGHGSDIQFIMEGELEGCTSDEAINLLNDYKIRSALVRIRGKVSIDILEDAVFGNAIYRPTFVLANKADLVSDAEVLESLLDISAPLDVVAISTIRTPELARTIGKKLFEILGIVRVYTKQPRKPPEEEPIVGRKGLTVGELAKMVHSDFYKQFKYARVWGPSAKFKSGRVGIDQELSDGDIVQFHV